MKKLTLAFAVAMAFLAVGCKKKGGDSAAAMKKMTEFKDQMCACKDAECAKKVSDAMLADSKASAGKETKYSEADQKKATEIGTAMSECMTKAMGMGGAGSAEGSAAGSAEGSAAGSAEGSAAGSAEGSAAAGSAAAGSGSAAAGSGSAAAGSAK